MSHKTSGATHLVTQTFSMSNWLSGTTSVCEIIMELTAGNTAALVREEHCGAWDTLQHSEFSIFLLIKVFVFFDNLAVTDCLPINATTFICYRLIGNMALIKRFSDSFCTSPRQKKTKNKRWTKCQSKRLLVFSLLANFLLKRIACSYRLKIIKQASSLVPPSCWLTCQSSAPNVPRLHTLRCKVGIPASWKHFFCALSN